MEFILVSHKAKLFILDNDVEKADINFNVFQRWRSVVLYRKWLFLTL